LGEAIKKHKKKEKDAIRVALAEFSREREKEITDEKAVKILRKLISNEQELENPDPVFIETLSIYLPKEASDDEISRWINSSIDFSLYKNKMQAMKPIITHFGARASGDRIKEILKGIPDG
jgi:uncharacterized protein YqeY